MGDKTFSMTRLFDHESVNIATRAIEWSGDDSPSKSSIGQWARLFQILPYTGSPLSSTFANHRHGEDNEESLWASIYDCRPKLEDWIANVPSLENESKCSLSMTMRNGVIE